MSTAMTDVLVRVGPGTKMGNVLRRFWVPACLSSELPDHDSAPVRVRILGEKLIGFRDSLGRVGLVEEFCSHRGASLFLGRNEECGIRCSYHGWKFDITGACVDLPQAPHLAPKMGIKGYPCVERGGVVWAYMGPPEHKPEPPELEWALLPEAQRYVTKRYQECGWLQAMEGGIDTTHASFVHKYELARDPMHRDAAANKYIYGDGAAVFEIRETPHGLTIYGRRKGEPDSYYWRVTQWIFPWFTLIPPFGPHALGSHIWVPIDDETCWGWSINFTPFGPLDAHELEAMRNGEGIHYKPIPGTHRPLANPENDWLVDRQAQREKRSFSGVAGFSIQDSSLQESMGPIQDYSREHLVGTDMPIVMARRALYRAAMELENGHEPPGLTAASQRIRAASVLLPHGVDIEAWARESLTDSLSKPVWTV